ncbi:DUF6402 family protein, partial [Klebsiella pneumoniae]
WLMMSLWDALRMNMMISYQELVRTFLRKWQTKHNTGGDFIVLSDVLWLEPFPKDKVIVL